MSSPKRGTDLSRLPHATSDEATQLSEHVTDQQGKRALFSAPGEQASPVSDPTKPAVGSVVIDCGRCAEQTVLSPATAVRHAIPSLHLPFLKKEHGSWMRCPACQQRTWVSVRIQV